MTITLSEALLQGITSTIDALGDRLFTDDMMAIWKEQKKHVVIF